MNFLPQQLALFKSYGIRGEDEVKAENPPKFLGGPHEDVIDWMDRYETIGAYNGWDDADLRKFFIIYLECPARQWYQCKHGTFPQIWASTPAVMVGNVVQEQAVKNTKEMFLEELQKGNNKLFMERLLDHNLDENNKLDYLYQGLKRSIFTSVCIQKPETYERFLKLIKLHAEDGDMTRKNNSRVGMVLADEDPAEEGASSDQLTSDLLAFIGARPNSLLNEI